MPVNGENPTFVSIGCGWKMKLSSSCWWFRFSLQFFSEPGGSLLPGAFSEAKNEVVGDGSACHFGDSNIQK